MKTIVAIILIIVIWFICKVIRNNKIYKKYSISRNEGRNGYLLYEDNRKKTKIEWEILIGDIDFVLYDKGIEWVEPIKEKLCMNLKSYKMPNKHLNQTRC
ncbi:MAG: hypothetical protein GXP13_09640 [Gammaproteobacteria bacterium]|nr:hypothetical protein [Gammaproteobacteria bacterium]